jgi:hypothetical protein
MGEQEEAACARLIPGPIKKPERALQKLVRLYNRNPACLTDLVRCTVVVAGLREAAGFLELLGSKSVIGISETSVEDILGRDGSVHDSPRIMRITQLKNRLDLCYKDIESMGYRDLCLNVEVGWTVENGAVQLQDVKDWFYLDCKTLICEIQGICMHVIYIYIYIYGLRDIKVCVRIYIYIYIYIYTE